MPCSVSTRQIGSAPQPAGGGGAGVAHSPGGGSVVVADDSLSRRSTPAAAKNADAVLRISLARRSSAFSRRRRLSSSDSAVLTPGTRPSSMSACLHQPRNVSGRIPNCGPIRLHAALTDSPGSCARASRTIRLARCLISSLNFLGAGTISTFPWDQSLHHTRCASIVTWIETTYHRRRRQEALARLTPIEFET